uniref:Uncharacterized protein n=1 Tax=Aegilops tauschii subsp. strangulata TaxID=200361 RepID=A0A453S813_AEGTS
MHLAILTCSCSCWLDLSPPPLPRTRAPFPRSPATAWMRGVGGGSSPVGRRSGATPTPPELMPWSYSYAKLICCTCARAMMINLG